MADGAVPPGSVVPVVEHVAAPVPWSAALGTCHGRSVQKSAQVPPEPPAVSTTTHPATTTNADFCTLAGPNPAPHVPRQAAAATWHSPRPCPRPRSALWNPDITTCRLIGRRAGPGHRPTRVRPEPGRGLTRPVRPDRRRFGHQDEHIVPWCHETFEIPRRDEHIVPSVSRNIRVGMHPRAPAGGGVIGRRPGYLWACRVQPCPWGCLPCRSRCWRPVAEAARSGSARWRSAGRRRSACSRCAPPRPPTSTPPCSRSPS